MTQAYIEGFSKTAEAYGVDPQALLKLATDTVRPTYETNGWAPSSLEDSNESVPHLFAGGSTEDAVARGARLDPRVEKFLPFLTAPGPAGNWWKAHLAASKDARSYQAALNRATKDAPNTLKNRGVYLFSGKWPQVRANAPEVVSREANARYHKNMMALTNSAPSSLSYSLTHRQN